MLVVSLVGEIENERPRILYSYCPGYNTDWLSCCGKRPLQMEINFANQGIWANKVACYAQNNSALGTRLCQSLK